MVKVNVRPKPSINLPQSPKTNLRKKKLSIKLRNPNAYLFGAIFASELAGAIAFIVGHFRAIFNAGTAIGANIVNAWIF